MAVCLDRDGSGMGVLSERLTCTLFPFYGGASLECPCGLLTGSQVLSLGEMCEKPRGRD